MENSTAYQRIFEGDYQIILYHNESFTRLSDNVDIEVITQDGQRYSATLFTLQNIKELMEKYSSSGECNNGKYFWTTNMIILCELTPESIKETVSSLIKTGELRSAFALLTE